MHYSDNRFRASPDSKQGRPNFRSNRKQRSFDPSLLIVQATTTTQKNRVEDKVIPVNAFSDFPIVTELKNNIASRGYLSPTPVQDKVIPLILEGRDVVGIANTGTGKTAAFLIPLINKTFLDRSQKVLIITPTRELAVQIRDELFAFSKGMNINAVLCIGGVSIKPQAERLRRNPQFVIGTPGRLQDLERGRRINFASFSNIVLDEVDRMLDIGFVQEIKHIVACLPINRHSLFFSATLPPKVQEIMDDFSKNPQTIFVKSTDHLSNISQDVVRINGKAKVEVLHDLLIQEGFTKVLVFGRTKFGMERLARDLFQRGFRVAAIHGNKTQSQRQRALLEFKNNQVQVLLATDVASRGLDINDITHVINYDLPESYEDYIHRIGRTGRANKQGTALTFIS